MAESDDRVLPYRRAGADGGETNHPLALVALSYALSVVFAVAYVVVHSYSLPPTDGAYGKPPFGHPLVLPIMLMGAGVAGTIVCLPTVFALRRREWITSTFILCVVVLFEIAVVTPIDSRAGMIGSVLAYLVGLLLARRFAIRL